MQAMKVILKCMAVAGSIIATAFFVNFVPLERLDARIWLHVALVVLYLPLVVSVEAGSEISVYERSFLIFWKRTHSIRTDYLQVRLMGLIPLGPRMDVYSVSSFDQPGLEKVVADILEVASAAIPVIGSLMSAAKTSVRLLNK